MHLIVRVIASEANAGEHENMPVVHAFATSLRRRLAVDVTANELHEFFGQVRFGIHMLQ